MKNRGIPVKDLAISKDGKLVKKVKRYDLCTEAKRATSKKVRPVKRSGC